MESPETPLVVRSLDEALRTLELRRYRRIFGSARLPLVYAGGVLIVAWVLVPLFFGENGVLAGTDPLYRYAGFAPGVLFTLSALAALLGGYLRAQHLWNQERQLRSFHNWLLTRQSPGRVAVTVVAMASMLGLSMSAIPFIIGLVAGLLSGLQWWQYLLTALLMVLCALTGAAAGAAVFFTSFNLAPRRLYYPALAVLAVLAAVLWLQIERTERGWERRWDEHPGRALTAAALITPVPALFGASAPRWWARYPGARLGDDVQPWAWGLLYCGLLLAVAGWATLVSVRGYAALARDPDRLDERPRAPTDEGGREFYWKGFRNPVWTRDIRTRLRNKDTAEFIFFASIAVAAGAFVPLIMTVNDLSDPLQTALAARQIFFWLTMTLVALVTLITPSLTADVITQERAQGTLEMLVGTALRPREILVGKLLGAVSVMLLLISPSLPLFGLCYLFHGASGPQVLGVYALLIGSLAVSAFIGLAQSAINNRSGAAKFWAYALTACFVGLPGGPFSIAAAITAPQPEIQRALRDWSGIVLLAGAFWAFVLVLMWGNASEQLEYSEY